jgi:hypothetical protein
MKDRIIPSIFSRLEIVNPANKVILSPLDESIVISLHGYCVDIFITEITEAFFGPALLQKFPGLIKSFLDWEYCNWRFLFMLPNVLRRTWSTRRKQLQVTLLVITDSRKLNV